MPDEPIVLPGLAEERREPSAAVCASGHLLAWSLDPSFALDFCPKCGEPVLRSCPHCRAPLPPDPEMLQWVPYHSNCIACGKPYPWRAAEIARAKRTLAEHAEVEAWEAPLHARAAEILDDIVAERAAPSAIVAGLRWLAAHGAESATPAILDVVDRLGTAELKQALRPSFPGSF
ncbi:MAG: DUF2321 domain-containing protein [Candidatus Eremiobacteraeota bacterium]|nr:DUF2321 domain-containing protein [Candidatus Eremiobacteraeota bacterium]